jgi:hypothetical protein
MIGTKRHGVGFEDRLGPFSLHDASRSILLVLIKIGHVCFLTLLVMEMVRVACGPRFFGHSQAT